MIKLEANVEVPASVFTEVSDAVHAILNLDVHVHVLAVTLFSNTNFQLTDERRLGVSFCWFLPNKDVTDSS
jgi:hypothetical protein